MKKLAIITTHPIQYYAPVFQRLQERGGVLLKVFYTLGTDSRFRNDPGFGQKISWDIPLLEGYEFEWVLNTAVRPGSDRFNGIVNPTLNKRVAQWAPHAILVIGWAYDSHLKALRYFHRRVPVYFRGDSTLLQERRGVKSLLRGLCLKWVYRHVDHAFYNGSHNKAYFKKYGFREQELTFAPHAVDNDRFALDRSEEAATLRRVLGVSATDILIVFAGKFEPVKQVALLVAAFNELERSGVHLLLVGSGAEENRLRRQAASGREAARIHFMGFRNQTEMPVIYQAADLFCLPSGSETWGLSINEAMACKKAILASDRCGCAVDLVQPGYNGFIFKSGDQQHLLSCLEQLTADKEQLRQFGQASAIRIAPWNFFNIATAITNVLTNETD
jgi:glycosyltransferase involved in cell wall biosynthesis